MITYQVDGPRTYVLGDTYAYRVAIRSAGGHWDADRKAWWIGNAAAENLKNSLQSASPVYSYVKIGDAWGIRGPLPAPSVGAQVTVRKKSGEESTERITGLVSTPPDVATSTFYATIAPRAKSSSGGSKKSYTPRARSPRRKYECGECGDYVYPGTSCWETGCMH